MKIRLAIIFLFIVASSGMLLSQHTNVVIGTSQLYGLPTEPAVIMNPQNTDEILVGGMPNYYYYSTDGGYIWSHEFLQSPYGVNADPPGQHQFLSLVTADQVTVLVRNLFLPLRGCVCVCLYAYRIQR
ncbi:MAG: hypothetical protein NT175_00125 [Bacteroidetes bacterium]|nr:hypothetical protein [Bacteroidota bacterium]